MALACGPTEQRTLPDESGDLGVGLEAQRTHHLEGTLPVGPEVGGTQWRFVEAHCTEGPLDLSSQQFQRVLGIESGPDGLMMTYDHRFGDACTETIIQRMTPGTSADDAWRMREESRVTLGECPVQPDFERPADVRKRGDFLEVFIQRSQWCGGYEVRMVYAPETARMRDPEQVVRHYAAHFNRRDARAVTMLFSEAGSLVEPFNRTALDQPTRHDGRESIFGWYEEAFSNTPWLAIRVTDITPAETEGSFVMNWHYMDPRLDVPFAGRNRFTIAAGEIFEATMEITAQAVEVEAGEEPPSEAGPQVTEEELASEPAEEEAESAEETTDAAAESAEEAPAETDGQNS